MWPNIGQNQQKLPMIMPMPTGDPWTLKTMPWELASTNQDTGTFHFHAQNVEPRLQTHHKRKSDLAYDGPAKQFISEEKITAHFNGMHISSNYIDNTDDFDTPSSSGSGNKNGKCFTNLTYQDYQLTAKELEEKLKKATRLTLCDEVKKRIDDEQRKLTLLPDRLINHSEQPCKALILWQPSSVWRLADKKYVTCKESKPEESSDKLEVEEETAQDEEIEDFENNNSCMMDFNNPNTDGMEEDL